MRLYNVTHGVIDTIKGLSREQVGVLIDLYLDLGYSNFLVSKATNEVNATQNDPRQILSFDVAYSDDPEEGEAACQDEPVEPMSHMEFEETLAYITAKLN